MEREQPPLRESLGCSTLLALSPPGEIGGRIEGARKRRVGKRGYAGLR